MPHLRVWIGEICFCLNLLAQSGKDVAGISSLAGFLQGGITQAVWQDPSQQGAWLLQSPTSTLSGSGPTGDLLILRRKPAGNQTLGRRNVTPRSDQPKEVSRHVFCGPGSSRVPSQSRALGLASKSQALSSSVTLSCRALEVPERLLAASSPE